MPGKPYFSMGYGSVTVTVVVYILIFLLFIYSMNDTEIVNNKEFTLNRNQQ
jgi:hypothetical protein